MASAIFDTHGFVKRLTAAGMPAEQAEIPADEHARLLGEKLAAKQDVTLLRTDLVVLEQRVEDQLTIRVGGMLAAAGQAALMIGAQPW
jgi:hypothetical protein